MLDQRTKRIVSWLVVAAGSLGVALSYFAIWIIAAYFVAGIAWFASFALFVSGPISAVGALLARRKPRQKAAFVIGLTGFMLWIVLWILLFTVGGLGFDPHD
nr:hypothetical protein [Candidatus Acidoferrales bacterium]